MTSDECMDGEGFEVTFEAAAHELERHGMQWQRPISEAFAGHIFGRDWEGSEWEAIPLNSKAVLEWLGY